MGPPSLGGVVANRGVFRARINRNAVEVCLSMVFSLPVFRRNKKSLLLARHSSTNEKDWRNISEFPSSICFEIFFAVLSCSCETGLVLETTTTMEASHEGQ